MLISDMNSVRIAFFYLVLINDAILANASVGNFAILEPALTQPFQTFLSAALLCLDMLALLGLLL